MPVIDSSSQPIIIKDKDILFPTIDMISRARKRYKITSFQDIVFTDELKIKKIDKNVSMTLLEVIFYLCNRSLFKVPKTILSDKDLTESTKLSTLAAFVNNLLLAKFHKRFKNRIIVYDDNLVYHIPRAREIRVFSDVTFILKAVIDKFMKSGFEFVVCTLDKSDNFSSVFASNHKINEKSNLGIRIASSVVHRDKGIIYKPNISITLSVITDGDEIHISKFESRKIFESIGLQFVDIGMVNIHERAMFLSNSIISNAIEIAKAIKNNAAMLLSGLIKREETEALNG